MSRNTYILSLILIAGALAGPASAQAPATPPASPSPLSPEQMMAKEKAVEQHAQKRADCKRQAKEAGLGYTARKKFVRECMEEK